MGQAVPSQSLGGVFGGRNHGQVFWKRSGPPPALKYLASIHPRGKANEVFWTLPIKNFAASRRGMAEASPDDNLENQRFPILP